MELVGLVVFLVIIAAIALSLVPFGSTGRSVADRVAPRSRANTDNSKLD
jgi:hypothetical protein